MFSLWRNHLGPTLALIFLIALSSYAGQEALSRFSLLWLQRPLGILGTLLIFISFLYSARKRRWIKRGNPKSLLSAHETLATVGALLIFVHCGREFHSLLPWLAALALFINVISGLVGKLLLKNSRQALKSNKLSYQKEGLSQEEIELKLFWDAVAIQAMERWRAFHLPLFSILLALALLHIGTAMLFWFGQ